MNEELDKAGKDNICFNIPKALYDRVETYCNANKMSADEFIFDAISEKLTSVHKERRRKQRL